MALEVLGLTKSYGGVTVMSSVDLRVADGSIHALLGANGAGKSTLIKCVSGAVQPDRGEIRIGEHRARSHTPRSAKQAGVSVIYQDFSVAASLDVAENVFLGQELRRGIVVRRRAQRRETRRLIERLGAELDPDSGIDLIGGAGLQLIEIMKALVAEPSVLILDEPTAALTEDEARKLGDQCRRLRDSGLAILYVTHRLAEVFELADTVTVMRGGEVVFTKPVSETTHGELVDTIAGREMTVAERDAQRRPTGAAVLQVDGLLSAGIGPLSFDVHEGEVLGIYGLLGSGRTELVETLAGAQRRVAGTVTVDGRRRNFRDVADGVAAGVALVPSDRLRKGVFLDRSGSDNVLLPSYGRLARGGIRNTRRERERFASVAGALCHCIRGAVTSPAAGTPVATSRSWWSGDGCPPTAACCCSTSRRRASTSARAATCTTRCASWPPTGALQWSPRRSPRSSTRSPTASSCSPVDGSSPSCAARRCPSAACWS